jgi:hypothetical protein
MKDALKWIIKFNMKIAKNVIFSTTKKSSRKKLQQDFLGVGGQK